MAICGLWGHKQQLKGGGVGEAIGVAVGETVSAGAGFDSGGASPSRGLRISVAATVNSRTTPLTIDINMICLRDSCMEKRTSSVLFAYFATVGKVLYLLLPTDHGRPAHTASRSISSSAISESRASVEARHASFSSLSVKAQA